MTSPDVVVLLALLAGVVALVAMNVALQRLARPVAQHPFWLGWIWRSR